MGTLLPKPNTEQASAFEEYRCYNKMFEFGMASMQGWSSKQEDYCIYEQVNDQLIFGIFDGHGGRDIADYLKKNFISTLIATKEYQEGSYQSALEQCFLQLDLKAYRYLRDSSAGSSAHVIFITDKHVYSANVGDSKSVIIKSENKIEISTEHKPELEKQRIEKYGGKCIDGRINGLINISRSIGDFSFKKLTYENSIQEQRNIALTPFPEVKVHDIENIQLIIIGSRGLWDCYLTNLEGGNQSTQEIPKFFLENDEPQDDICKKFLNLVVAPNTNVSVGLDNMTIIAIKRTIN